MKLTLNDKRAFVRTVMADVPHEDYESLSHKTLTDWLVDQMPEKVRAVWDDPNTRGYIVADECYVPDGCFIVRSVALVPPRKIDKDVVALMQAFAKMDDAQRFAKTALRDKVNALIHSCTTLKNALSILPEELHKYLPTARDGSATKNVPVVIGDIVNALKAAGWPTDKGEVK